MFVKGSLFNFNLYVLNKKSKNKCKVKKKGLRLNIYGQCSRLLETGESGIFKYP